LYFSRQLLLLLHQCGFDRGVDPHGVHQVLPGVLVRNEDAARWMVGQIAFPQEVEDPRTMRVIGEPHPPNEGVNLIAATASLEQAVQARIPLVNEVHNAEADWDEVEARGAGSQATNPDDARAKRDKRDTARRMPQCSDEQIASIRAEIRDAREALLGMRSDVADGGTEGND
jgi:hypothetical protein